MALLRQLFARGASVRQAAAAVSLPKSTVHKLAQARGWKRRRRGLPAKQQRTLQRLLDSGASLRAIARIVGCGKSTVSRRRRTHIDRALGALRPVPAWRCPGCGGLLQVASCLRCQLARGP